MEPRIQGVSKPPKGMYKIVVFHSINGLFVDIKKPLFFVNIKKGTPEEIIDDIVKALLKGKPKSLVKYVDQGYMTSNVNNLPNLIGLFEEDEDPQFTISDLMNMVNEDYNEKLLHVGYDNHNNCIGSAPEMDEEEDEESTDTRKIVLYASGDSPQIMSARYAPYIVEIPEALVGNEQIETTIRDAVFDGNGDKVKKLHSQGIIKSMQAVNNFTEDITLADFYKKAHDKKIVAFLDEKNHRVEV